MFQRLRRQSYPAILACCLKVTIALALYVDIILHAPHIITHCDLIFLGGLWLFVSESSSKEKIAADIIEENFQVLFD